jgi:hypothetical protein
MFALAGEGNGHRGQASAADVVFDGIDAEAAQQVFAEDDRDAAECGGADQDELGPAKEESGGRPQPSRRYA